MAFVRECDKSAYIPLIKRLLMFHMSTSCWPWGNQQRSFRPQLSPLRQGLNLAIFHKPVETRLRDTIAMRLWSITTRMELGTCRWGLRQWTITSHIVFGLSSKHCLQTSCSQGVQYFSTSICHWDIYWEIARIINGPVLAAVIYLGLGGLAQWCLY